MKYLYTLLLSTVCFQVFAQPKTSNDYLFQSRNTFDKIEKLNNTSSNKKTRALDDRMIAQSYESVGYNDSTTFTYSGARGSLLHVPFSYYFIDVRYDESISYDRITTLPKYKFVQTYNANNDVVTQTQSMYNASNWVLTGKITNTYDANNNKTIRLYDSWNGTNWENNNKTEYTYTGGNHITEINSGWNGTSWDPISKVENSYDANNNLLEEDNQTWSGGVWVNSYVKTMTYDVNNNILTEEIKIWNVSAWVNTSRQTYAYNASNKADSMIYESADATNQWVKKERNMYEWTGNRITHIFVDSFNAITQWDKYKRSSFTYNANEYPLTSTGEIWNGTNYIFDPINQSKVSYYYEQYNNTVGTTNLEKNLYSKLYPNPANDVLHIALQGKNIETLHTKISNVVGQVFLQHTVSKPYGTVDIDIASLPTGIYYLQLSDEKNTIDVVSFVKK